MQDGIVRGNNRAIIRVTPTLTAASAYASGDVLFTATEIPNAVLGNGGCSKLLSFFVLDQAKQTFDAQFYFSENNTALGTRDATANISDADMEAIGFNSMCFLDASEGATGAQIDNMRIHEAVRSLTAADNRYPMGDGLLLQAASDSTSVYVQAVLVSATTPTYAADDIDLILHLEG